MIYFDNAATTRPSETVIEAYAKSLLSDFANPASVSRLGLYGEKIIENARKDIAKIIGANFSEIYFTSGGTESDNMAIFGAVRGYHRTKKHIITVNTEHPAVLMPYKFLEEKGFSVDYLSVDEKGKINLDELRDKIRDDTLMVSVMAINNETGTIQDIKEIGKIIKEKNKETLFHTDAVQAFGKYRINVKECFIDLLSASGHKFHAPKGTGFIYIKNKLNIKPIIFGGGHQDGMRSGTENPSAALALSLAANEAYSKLEEHNENVLKVKKTLAEGILKNIEDTYINGDDIENASPYVLNIGFKDLRSEVLLHALEERDIFVSSGSACDSRKKKQSGVLKSMGLSDEIIEGSIRFSFSRFSTVEEAEETVKVLCEVVPLLRRFNRKR